MTPFTPHRHVGKRTAGNEGSLTIHMFWSDRIFTVLPEPTTTVCTSRFVRCWIIAFYRWKNQKRLMRYQRSSTRLFVKHRNPSSNKSLHASEEVLTTTTVCFERTSWATLPASSSSKSCDRSYRRLHRRRRNWRMHWPLWRTDRFCLERAERAMPRWRVHRRYPSKLRPAAR